MSDQGSKNSKPGKVAVITGAARGIGLATAKLLASQDWQVALVDRDTAELNLAATACDGALAVNADVSDPEQVEHMTAAVVELFGRIDALVNNAGVADFGPLLKTSFDRWRDVMATNLDGVFLCSQSVIPELIKTRGSIVNIASISGLRASTLRIAYGTSKAAVMHMTQQQAAELGEHLVRVNCVAPGPVKTKLAMAVHTPDIVSAYHDAIPLNRYGTEGEIAELIAFLLSEKASYITGQIIDADGGFEAVGVGLPALRNAADIP